MFKFFLMFNSAVLKVFTSFVTAALIFIIRVGIEFLAVIFFIIGAAVFTAAPFFPARKRILSKMFEFADIKPGDRVYDLGCGDGRFVFEAERKGADAVGVELNILVYFLALFNKKRFGSKCEIRRANLYQTDLRDADVVFCHLMPWSIKRLAPKLEKELKKGCKVVSHGLKLPGREITESYHKGGINRYSVFLYII